ncbi:LacI family DNA-binding transcriptional regulator [Fibrella sp. WM1]|uniref:LacI family DNA-binding transcriptional regulator n=1 Tax=Fibrella musci TaxID=3242485 RepID=UPI003521345B
MEKETTIYDIAERLKLSPATISRALNDHPAINHDTKSIIAATAQQMGYRANMFASNLRRQRSNTIGVIVGSLTSSFMSSVLAGMEQVANEASYNLIISQSLESAKKEIANARTMFDSRVDGLLVSVAYDTDSFDHFEPFIRKKIPLLFFDRVLTHKQCTSITIDNAQAGYEATSHLIEQGCRRIMHVTGSLKRNVYADRLAGYRQALMQHNLPIDESLILVTNLDREAGFDAARQLQAMDNRPDGMFITNDFCAASSIIALQKLGLSVPNDVAVVGFNDDTVAQIVAPQLTTIHYSGITMGEVAAKSLINHLTGVQDILTTNRIILRSELVIRESSLRSAGGVRS